MHTVRTKTFADVSLQDRLFTSLKTDYPDFEGWFERRKQGFTHVGYKLEERVCVKQLKNE